MIELKEKFLTPAEARKQFKDSLIEHIFELTFQKAREKKKGTDPTDTEIKEGFRSIMDRYEKVKNVRGMLGIDTHEDWDSFFDEAANQLIRIISEKRSGKNSETSTSLRSEDLIQKKLFD